MSQRPSESRARDLDRTFRSAAAELAGELRAACRPRLPARQSGLLGRDELSVIEGLERTGPLTAAAMALAPAVAAVGAGLSSLPGTPSEAAGVAASVLDAASDALDALGGPAQDATLRLGHSVARATHLASTLAGSRSPDASRLRRAGGPTLWPRLVDALTARISAARGAAVGPLPGPLGTASACRTAALRCMGAHAEAAGGATSTTERLLRCLTFASLYSGFACLDHGPRGWTGQGAVGAGAARADLLGPALPAPRAGTLPSPVPAMP